MARTKVNIMLHFLFKKFQLLTDFLAIASKPLASPLEVGNLAQSEISLKVNFDFCHILGKAPRKQLATKAARKTAAAVCIRVAPPTTM